MLVRVYQLWKEGKALDSRTRKLSDESCSGYLNIESRDGERYACLAELPYGQIPRKELLPRLWSPVVVSMGGNDLVLRGVQKNRGRLCHQEWKCYLMHDRG